jgi:peptidoglycan/LPS O-acetylase OafA/YrhL
MKRTFVLILAAVAAVAVFGWLVHMVLVAAHLSEPTPTTVYGMTPRRLWATAVSVLALVAVVIGGLALRQSAGRVGNGRMGAMVATMAGLIAAVNGGLNLAIATGGPGSGNGVIGGAAALVLGLIAMALGGLALARPRRRVGAAKVGD